MRKGTIIGALTLGLCLLSSLAFVYDFRITNNAGEQIAVECSKVWQAGITLNNGATQSYECDGTVLLEWMSGGTEHSVYFDCPTDQVQLVTVTAGNSADELSSTQSCEASS